MQYIHVRNIEKFHPGYRDRDLKWAKIYFKMVQGDPDCEMITNEIDWARLVKFIILELQAQKPIPLDEKYLIKKGLDFKQRKLSSTLESLKAFINLTCNESVTNPLRFRNVDKNRIEENRVEENKNRYAEFENSVLSKWNSFCDKYPKLSKISKISNTRRKHLKERFVDSEFKDFDKILQAIEKQPFLINGNPNSRDHKDWHIDFDWIIKNDTNYIKVLELKYMKKGGNSW